MNVIVMAASLLAIVGYYLWLAHPIVPTMRDQPAAESLASAVLLAQKAAVDWCLRDTTCAPSDGIVPADQLLLPPGYRPGTVPFIVSTADGHRVSTYLRVFPQAPNGLRVDLRALARGLGTLAGGGPAVGLARQGSVVAGDGGSTVGVTALVPDGVPVVSQKVR